MKQHPNKEQNVKKGVNGKSNGKQHIINGNGQVNGQKTRNGQVNGQKTKAPTIENSNQDSIEMGLLNKELENSAMDLSNANPRNHLSPKSMLENQRNTIEVNSNVPSLKDLEGIRDSQIFDKRYSQQIDEIG